MSGLRERQKEQRKEAILDSAMMLFKTQGYASTTVEQIAAGAGVSAPTVFNYFGSKQVILLGLVGRVESAGTREALIKLDGYDNAVDALCDFHTVMTMRELQTLPVQIWRELMNQSFDPTVSREMSVISAQTAREITVFLEQLRDRKLIDDSVDLEFVGTFMSDFSLMLFARLVQTDDVDLKALDLYSRKGIEMLFRGLHP